MGVSLRVVCLVLLFSVTVVAQSEEASVHLAAPAYPCQGFQSEYSHVWVNPWGPTYLTGGYVWSGTGRGLRADIGVRMLIHRPGTWTEMLMFNTIDRYQDPNCAECAIFRLPITPGNYVTVPMGGSVELRSACAMVGDQDATGYPAGIPAGGYGNVSPLFYFANVGAHQHQALLRVVWEKPGQVLQDIRDRLDRLLQALSGPAK